MKKNSILLFGIIFIIIIVILSSKIVFKTEKTTIPTEQLITVNRQSFRLEVVERGIVRPARITAIKSNIAGNLGKLIWTLPEGSQIRKGLLIARFDTKPMMDTLLQAEQQKADAEARWVIAIRALELMKEAATSKEEAALRKLEIAGIKADNFRNGSGPLERKKLEQQVKKDARTRDIRKKAFEDMKPLLDNGHITLREYEKAANELLSARENLVIAKAALKNFDAFEWPKILREADMIKEAAQMELERVKRTNELERQQQQAKIEKYRRDLEVKQQEVDRAKREVAACDIYAPTDGILLYSTLPYEGKKRKIQIGDSIWFGQTFLEIPDTTDLIVELNIREIDVTKLSVGMETEITLDAYPDKVFHGTLSTIDALAQQDENHTSIRRFSATIHFNETSPLIHVGMSAGVKIIYRQLKNILAVPAGAISYTNGIAMVRKGPREQAKETIVKIGAVGVRWVEITDGLKENDQILLDIM